MDLSDRASLPPGPQRQAIDPLHPQALIAQLSTEVAGTLSSALERVGALAATGRIDREGLRALHAEIDGARRAGIIGQQVVRLGQGLVALTEEQLDLSALLREALRQRSAEIEKRGIEVRQALAQADVNSDATLLFSLLQTALDWSFEHAVARIDLKLDLQSWPAQARVHLAFAHLPPDEVATAPVPWQPAEEAALNTMSWRLLQQTAAVLGLPLQRQDSPGKTALVIEFPQTLATRLAVAQPPPAHDLVAQPHNLLPLAGRHVLVLAGRREVRHVVREALRPMGLMTDFVGSVEEAKQLCAEALPHAVIYEASMGGERFERLRSELLTRLPPPAFIQLAEQGRAFEVLKVGGRQFASVGREAITQSLPSALLFELSRQA